jgi:hypothetical protein
MPRGDRTGPAGAGPRSGRAAGYCTGNDMPGFANPGPGRGFGRGWGRGFGCGWGRGFGGGGWGWRHWFNASWLPGWMRFGGYTGGAPSDPVVEKKALKDQADFLQSELESIKKRLSEIESDKS